ncbi:MAG TPA: FAD-dependent oxidoreductase, partial [Candidatus Limnocylindrales bacterium]|nr:FAD-dependent oxidoreductase [Candidatus Limnocylindrales bacterium]
MPARYDLFVLGSGSTAFAAAIRAHDLGARIGMAERRTIGGTCANRGCLPSKNLIEAARIVHEAAEPRYPGLRPAAIGVDAPELVRQKDEVVRAYRQTRYVAVAEGLAGLDVLTGEATFESPTEVRVDGRPIEADRFLIATGSRPAVPPIPGLERTPYLTSDLLDADEPGRLTEVPGSLVVLGGGYVAVELAQLFARLGSQVAVVARSGLLSDHEPEIRSVLEATFRAEGIAVLAGTRTLEVRGTDREVRVEVETPDGRRSVRAERLVVATGRTPNTDRLGLERAGVRTDRDGFVAVDAELRTSQPHIWAAGDVIGRQHGSQMATPVGARQGRLVADNALGGARLRF